MNNNKTAIQSAQIRQLFSTSNVSLVTSTLLAVILAYMQYGVIAPTVILGWLFFVVLVAFSRAALVKAFHCSKVDDYTATHVWLVRFRLGVLAVGVVWGTAGFLLFPTNDPQHQMFLIYMLAGLSAGGVASFSADLVSAILFSILSLLPLTIRLFITGDSLSVAMGMAGILYLSFMIINLRHFNRSLTENIILRLEAVAREGIVRTSEQRYRMLLNHLPVGIVHYDTNLVITYCNKRFADILHNSVDGIVGSDMKILKDQSILPASRNALRGELGLYEGKYSATASDTNTWIDMTCAPSHDETGKIMGGIAIVRDVTELKRDDQHLMQLKAMIDISLDGFYVVDLMGNIVQTNHAYAKMIGYSQDELVGMHLTQLDAVEGHEQIKAHIDKVVVQGFDIFETRQHHKNGHEIDLEISVAYLAKFGQICVFSRDISQRKLMELALKASEIKFRSIIEISPVPMALIDRQMNLIFLNPSFVQTFGYEMEEIPTLEDWCLRAYPDPDYRDWVKTTGQIIWEDVRQGQSHHTPMEISVCCKNNSIKTILASYSLIHKDLDGMGLVVLYDITQRTQIEAKFNSIFSASVEGFITVDINNVILACNPAIEATLGYACEELMGCNIKKILPSFSNKLSLPYTRESVFNVLEIEGIHKSGNLIPLDLTIAEYSINTTKYFTYIVRDITERKYREQLDKKHLDQLAHVTRLGLMGEMASGLAHEVNQPLTAIVNYTQVSLNLLKKENPDLIKLAEVAVKTQDQALRAGQIIHGVKRFCKATSQKRIATDINELINDSANLCADSLKQNCIKLTLELTDNLPLIQIDHIQIEQVILNLIRNGIDAILSTSEKRLREIIIQSYLMPNNEIQVRVKDNGSGIEEDQQVQILMPFHTTKSDGMGMGLSISRSLIEAHNGTLNFNSQFGKGSTFYITLPIIS